MSEMWIPDTDHLLLCGDALEVLRKLESESVHMVVTSPPYFGLRAYSDDPREVGREETPEEYIERLVSIFAQVRRVLREDGTCWVVIGDSFASGKGTCHNPGGGEDSLSVEKRKEAGAYQLDRGNISTLRESGLKPKDLIGIPWMLAFALRDDGWYLRQDVIWAKGLSGEACAHGWHGSCMPESTKDRPTTSHEHVFLLSKSTRYWYDYYAVREDGACPAGTKAAKGSAQRAAQEGVNARPEEYAEYDGKRNRRSVWTCSPKGTSLAHFACYPPALIEPMIVAGCPPHVCSECGEPWAHLVEKTRRFESGSGRAGNVPEGKNGAGMQGGGDVLDVRRGPCLDAEDLGYFPDCKCFTARNLALVVEGLTAERRRLMKKPWGEDREWHQHISRNIARAQAERDVILKREAAWHPGTVLDPFAGSGTTTQVARRLNRRSIGIDLNPAYEDVQRERLGIPDEGTLFSDEDLGVQFATATGGHSHGD